MEIVYPPVGIAHITGQIPDLIADRMTAASRVRVACAMQPKAAPHFGTGIVILTAFALARLFQDTFAKPATVLLDMLDNAPAQTTVIDGIEYTLCLSHAIDASRSAAETNTEPVRRLAAWASQRAGTGFGLRPTARSRHSRDSGTAWPTSCPARRCSSRCSARPSTGSASARSARDAAWSTRPHAPSKSSRTTA